MKIPADFRYREVLLRGRPQHDGSDAFGIRHPRMDPGHRAKIFKSFDALKGFNEAIREKNDPYEEWNEPGPDAAAELNRRLTILKKLTGSRRKASENRISVTVCFFEARAEEDEASDGSRGRYRTHTGVCLRVDDAVTGTLQLDGARIPLRAIRSIESAADIFRKDRLREAESAE